MTVVALKKKGPPERKADVLFCEENILWGRLVSDSEFQNMTADQLREAIANTTADEEMSLFLIRLPDGDYWLADPTDDDAIVEGVTIRELANGGFEAVRPSQWEDALDQPPERDQRKEGFGPRWVKAAE